MTRFLPAARRLLAAASIVTALSAFDGPVSPDAIPQASSLLDFLGNISGTQVLAGQQETVDWFGVSNEKEMDFLLEKTGRLPAYRGFDFMFMSDPRNTMQRVGDRAIAWAQRGGVVSICYHWFAGSPRAAFYTNQTDFDLTRALQPGTADNTEFIAEMDLVAAELKKLRDAGVPVIWRPFHECSGGWFWWGAKGSATFKQAWRFMYDRFTRVHRLTNLLWCYNPTETTGALESWYPGDGYVDIVSLDIYPPNGTHPTYATEYKKFLAFTGAKKVVLMSENGSIPDIDAMFAEGANWAAFCTWSDTFITDGQSNSLAFLQKVYTHSKVITLDEMPDVYRFASAPPTLVVPPANTTADTGARVTLSVLAQGTPPFAYQWSKDGADLPGAMSAELTLPTVSAAAGGAYRVKVTNPAGAVTSDPAWLTVNATAYIAPAATLAAISTRAFVRTGNDVPIVGFSIGGSGAKKFLLRASGPALTGFGVPGAIADPLIVLTRVSGETLATNDNWASGAPSAGTETAASAAGAFAFDFGSGDAALTLALPAGAYTAIVRGVNDGTGISLLELYDLDPDSSARLVGLSTRAWAGTGADAIVAGFAVRGTAGRSLLIRALGPKLASYGLTGTLADPQLELTRLDGTVLALNDNWSSDSAQLPALNAATTALGLQPFTLGSADAAMLRLLPQGLFTATIRGAGAGTGTALVEAYEAP